MRFDQNNLFYFKMTLFLCNHRQKKGLDEFLSGHCWSPPTQKASRKPGYVAIFQA